MPEHRQVVGGGGGSRAVAVAPSQKTDEVESRGWRLSALQGSCVCSSNPVGR